MLWMIPLVILSVSEKPDAIVSLHPAAGPSCLDSESLVRMDAGWEKALLEGDADFLQQRLADEFIWVHDHAAQIDSKEGVIKAFSGRDGTSSMRSRSSSEVEVRRLGATAVVTGYTVVERQESSTRYRFMRTYAEVSGSCFLLGNQTMAIPEG